VITACTGAGATATGIKTTLAAMKIGGETLGRAIMLGIETFGRAFVKDLGNIVKGVILFPKNAIRGAADLLQWIARGGKKLEPAKGAVTVAAKRAKDAEEAYHAVEAARGNPKKFAEAVRKNPHIMALYDEHLANLGRAGQKAAMEEARAGETARGEARQAERAAKEQLPAEPLSAEARAAGQIAEPEKAVMAGTKPIPETVAAGGIPVPAKPDIQPKAMTLERKTLFNRINAGGNKSIKTAMGKMRIELGDAGYLKLSKALPTEELRMLAANIDSLDATLIEKIFKQQYFTLETEEGIIRYYVGKSISVEGGFGLVSECAYVAGDGKFLKRGAVKMPFDPVAMRAELETLKGLKKLTEGQRKRMAKINEFLQNWEYAFKMDLESNIAVNGMPEVPHLLRPVALPKAGQPYAFIFPQIKPLAGRVDVGLKQLLESADIPPEDILQAGEHIAESAEGILERGYIPTDLKPGNVFVGTVDGEAVTLLGDLGLTKFEDVPHVQFTGTVERFPLEHYQYFAKKTFGYKPGRKIPAVIRDKPVVGHISKSFEEQFKFYKQNPGLFPPSCRTEVLDRLDVFMKRMKDVNDSITVAEVRAEFKALRELIQDARGEIPFARELPLAA